MDCDFNPHKKYQNDLHYKKYFSAHIWVKYIQTQP